MESKTNIEAAASDLFSLSPGTLYDVLTPKLVNSMGAVCSPAVLGTLSPSQLINFATLLPLSSPLVKGLPVTGFVSLIGFLSTGVGADALRLLPPSTLFGLLRGLFDTMADSSPYLLNGSTVPAVVAFLHSLLAPTLLNVLPLDMFHSLLTALWSSPSLLTAVDVAVLTDRTRRRRSNLVILDHRVVARIIRIRQHGPLGRFAEHERLQSHRAPGHIPERRRVPVERYCRVPAGIPLFPPTIDAVRIGELVARAITRYSVIIASYRIQFAK